MCGWMFEELLTSPELICQKWTWSTFTPQSKNKTSPGPCEHWKQKHKVYSGCCEFWHASFWTAWVKTTWTVSNDWAEHKTTEKPAWFKTSPSHTALTSTLCTCAKKTFKEPAAKPIILLYTVGASTGAEQDNLNVKGNTHQSPSPKRLL